MQNSYKYLSNTVHRTDISTEGPQHLAVINAGFFVLLGSFAVRGSNNLIRLSKKIFYRFLSLKIIILFEISVSGLFLKYSSKFYKFLSLDIVIKYVLIEKKECI